jgi:hypothetical protein
MPMASTPMKLGGQNISIGYAPMDGRGVYTSQLRLITTNGDSDQTIRRSCRAGSLTRRAYLLISQAPTGSRK